METSALRCCLERQKKIGSYWMIYGSRKHGICSKRHLPHCAWGSKILVTTRDIRVRNSISNKIPYPLQTLKDNKIHSHPCMLHLRWIYLPCTTKSQITHGSVNCLTGFPYSFLPTRISRLTMNPNTFAHLYSAGVVGMLDTKSFIGLCGNERIYRKRFQNGVGCACWI